MKKVLNSLFSGAFLVSVVYLALGVVLFAIPELTMETMVKAGALAIIVMGIVSLVKYLVRGVKGGHLNNFMTAGLTELAVGVTLLIKPELVTSFVPTLMGIAILVDGFSKLQRSMDMLRIKFGGWLLILAFSLFVMTSAALVFADPFKTPKGLTITIASAFIFAGGSGIAVWFVVSRQMKKYREKLEKDAQLKELADAAGISEEELKAARNPVASMEPGMPEISDPPVSEAKISTEDAASAVSETSPAGDNPFQAKPYVPSYFAENEKRVN